MAAAAEVPVGAAPVPVPASPAPPPSRPMPSAAPSPSAEINLGGVVGPVLVKRYGPWVAALALVAVIVWLISRR